MITEGSMSNDFARKWLFEAVDRVQAESSANERPEMAVNIGGVQVTVSGNGIALLLAPGLSPARSNMNIDRP